MLEKCVICLEEISSSQAKTESLVSAAAVYVAIPHHPPCLLEEKFVVQRDG